MNSNFSAHDENPESVERGIQELSQVLKGTFAKLSAKERELLEAVLIVKQTDPVFSQKIISGENLRVRDLTHSQSKILSELFCKLVEIH